MRPYFWIDMMNWAPKDLSPQTVYDLLKSLQPDCIVILNQHIKDGTKITCFPTDDGITSAWLEVDLGKPTTLGRAVIEQAYPELKRIRKFAIEYKHGNEWKACYQGENPDARLDVTFDPVSTRYVRLNVIESSDGPTISEFQLYQPATGK